MVAERDAAIRAACLHTLEVLYRQEGAPEVRAPGICCACRLTVVAAENCTSIAAEATRTYDLQYSTAT